MEADIHRPEADMQLKAVHPDAYVFTEPHRKFPDLTRLTIACHGIAGRQIEMNNTPVSPEELAASIRTWTAVDRLHSVRLVACHSASLAPGASRQRLQTTDPARLWSTAFGARLSAALPGVKVRSYVGEVTATCEHDLIWQAYRMMGPAFTADRLARNFTIIKDDPGEHYHSITFRDGLAIKQSYPIASNDGGDYAVL